MDKALLVPLILWAVMAVVTILRKSLPSVTRVLAGIPLIFYAFIFKDDFLALVRLKEIPYMEILKSFVEYSFVSLALLWPAALFLLQDLTDGELSAIINKLAVFSLIATAGFIYFN